MQRSAINGLLSGLLLATCAASNSVRAETAHIYFSGTIAAPTCSLQTSNITIPIGTVDRSVFTGVGSVSPYSPNVALISAGCNATLVSMTFSGTADADNPKLFAVTGGAKGVGIELAKTGGGAYAVPNDTSKPITFTPAAAGQGYSFAARYVQTTTTVTPGAGDATITVLITYT
jgi:major type 1 subunit fimbrin (pilin)